MHDRILEFVKENWQPFLVPGLEIFTLQHLLKCHAPIQLDDFHEVHPRKPLAVKHYFRPLRVEDLERLHLVSFCVRDDLFVCEDWPRSRSSCGIANHRGKIAYDQYSVMTAVLKLPELTQINGVPEMQIR